MLDLNHACISCSVLPFLFNMLLVAISSSHTNGLKLVRSLKRRKILMKSKKDGTITTYARWTPSTMPRESENTSLNPHCPKTQGRETNFMIYTSCRGDQWLRLLIWNYFEVECNQTAAWLFQVKLWVELTKLLKWLHELTDPWTRIYTFQIWA